MRLEDETYEFIKAEVVDLFDRYGVNCIPINGFELAMKMGIILISYSALSAAKLFWAETVSADGFYIEPGDGKEYILYNDTLGYERANMTILHEIAHGVLGHHEGILLDIREAEAAFFAKYAAAPPPLVHKIRPECREEIMDFFCISYEAAGYALEYYHKWKAKLYACGRLETYEVKLLKMFPQELEQDGTYDSP